VAHELGYQLYSIEELKKIGADTPAEPCPPTEEDICTIMYTSGTTGDPKGVLIKHSAVVACMSTLNKYCEINKIHFDQHDKLLSYLPLAHIFDR
jgi:long-chain acyl-CoA synthetase